ncbi:MAG TPA: winged helix DNA-binding domain-containing protein [Acidimicrobiales bacterium]
MTGPGPIARARMRATAAWDSDLPSPAAVVGHLLAVQAQEHPFARWSLAQRTASPVGAAAVDAAFDAGAILRTHVLRPTWHYVTPDDLAWLMPLSGPRVDRRNARRYEELELDARTLGRSDSVLAQAVTEQPLTRRQLGERLEAAGIPVGGQRLPHILFHAELQSLLVSGPMAGRQHTYAPFADRVPPSPSLDEDEALARLADRYFRTRGPAVLGDFAWWSGLDVPTARRALELASPALERMQVGDRTYWFASVEPVPSRGRADLVQCYDEAIISYRPSRDVLGTGPASFDVPGWHDGYSHVVLYDGRLLGHWKARPGSDRVEVRLAVTPSERQRRAVAAGVERYRRFVLT